MFVWCFERQQEIRLAAIFFYIGRLIKECHLEQSWVGGSHFQGGYWVKRTSQLFTQPSTCNTMTSAKLIFFLVCLEKIAQTATMEISPSEKWKNKFILVKPGETLMLPCFYEDKNGYMISWFKQSLEEKPRLVCASYRSSWKCFNSFENNPRFRLDTNNNGGNLTITDLEFSDSANYYCVNQNNYDYDFTEGYKVIVEGSELAITQSPSELAITQSPSEFIHSVGTGTPNCRVHTGTCDGEHTVYWFRNSGPSELSLVYSHKGRNNQCEKETNTCFYSLSMKNLNISQTGTYYCAVAACGHILFGGGATLKFEDDGDSRVLVVGLCGALAFSTFLAVCLAFCMCTMNSRHNCHCDDSNERQSLLSRAKACPDTRSCAGLRNRMQTEKIWTECVYFTGKH